MNDLSNDTFFARIMLQIDGRVMEIDSRPSDAIALAVRAQVPIFADESVLEKAGVKLDQEGQTLESITGETRGGCHRGVAGRAREAEPVPRRNRGA